MVHVLKHLHILQFCSQELKWVSQLLPLENHEENVSVRPTSYRLYFHISTTEGRVEVGEEEVI